MSSTYYLFPQGERYTQSGHHHVLIADWRTGWLEESLIPGSPDKGHAGHEAEEGGERGGRHHGVLRHAVVAKEEKGQQEVGVGRACNDNDFTSLAPLEIIMRIL